MSCNIITDKLGRVRVVVNRDQCVYCNRFRWCSYKLWFGKPFDCPKEEEQKNEK